VAIEAREYKLVAHDANAGNAFDDLFGNQLLLASLDAAVEFDDAAMDSDRDLALIDPIIEGKPFGDLLFQSIVFDCPVGNGLR
jgi:hypothetical protein